MSTATQFWLGFYAGLLFLGHAIDVAGHCIMCKKPLPRLKLALLCMLWLASWAFVLLAVLP